MQRLGSTVALIGLAAVLGAVSMMRLAAVPLLESSAGLVDINLGTALARAIVLRTTELALVGALAHAMFTVPRAPRGGEATLALLLLGTCLVERAWAAPALYAAWGRVDRVASLPVTRLEEARTLALQHDALLIGIALLCATAMWLGLARLGRAPDQEQAATERQGRQ